MLTRIYYTQQRIYKGTPFVATKRVMQCKELGATQKMSQFGASLFINNPTICCNEVGIMLDTMPVTHSASDTIQYVK